MINLKRKIIILSLIFLYISYFHVGEKMMGG